MAIYLLKNNAKSVKTTKRLIVAAETAADAKVFAATHFNGDGSWADADATALAAGTLADANSLAGFTFKVTVYGGAAQTPADDPVSVSHVGTATDALDDVAAALVILLNATTDIAAAAYAAPNLTVAAIGDGIGDATVNLEVFAPSGNTLQDIAPLYYASITDGGIAAAALVIALVADTEALPQVLAEA